MSYFSLPTLRTIHSSFIRSILYGAFLFSTVTLLNSCDDDGTDQQPEPSAPTITGFTPSSGTAGDTDVVITGTNFSANATANSVKIGSVTAVVKTATTTSLTITVPADATTGKISVTVNGMTATSIGDFTVTEVPNNEPSDFFTLTVDPAFDMQGAERWILASSKAGDWIDVESFESGNTVVLRGVVPDNGFFALHFLTVTQAGGNYHCAINTIGDVPVNGTWTLKTGPIATRGMLTVKVSNVPSNKVTVSSSAGTGSTSSIGSGTDETVEIEILKSPADVLVTMYPDGYPKYAFFNDVITPSTISLDQTTDGVAADRQFMMGLPTNSFYNASIDAFVQGQEYGFAMCRVFGSGDTNVKAGYNLGYDKYTTHIAYSNGNKSVSLNETGTTVKETHTFPSFDFTTSKSMASDFVAVSTLQYDVSRIDFGYYQSPLLISWNVVQPAKSGTLEISFKIKPLPQVIIDKYPFMPDISKIQGTTISGFQYSGTKTYSDIIEDGAKSGSDLLNLFTDNVLTFQQQN